MKNKKYYVLFFLFCVLICNGCSIEQSIMREKNDVSEKNYTEEKKHMKEEWNCANFAENDTEQNVAEDSADNSLEVEVTLEQKVELMLQNMTLEEKVAQLFVILPESLMTGVDCVTEAGSMTQAAFNEIPVGGFVYLSRNLESEEQVRTMLNNVQMYSMERIGIPLFLCVDEEGGTVTRVSGTGRFDVPVIEDMSIVGENKNCDRAYEIGSSMGQYLSALGFNVDFAPVADVLSNSENQVVKKRSFGSDPELVSDMSLEVMKGLEKNNVYATYKHFPGHGMTSGDTHEGYAYSNKSQQELENCELIPFREAIENNVSFIMIGHISLPEIIGDNTPASLSEYIVNDLLRKQMGYEGIVITDALNMGAIVQQYSSSEAAVKAIQAGADIILMPADFHEAYSGVIHAVENDILSMERIDESLKRVLMVKLQMQE